MVDRKKTKCCQPRRKTSEVGRAFQESAWKPSGNHRQIYPKMNNGQVDIKLGQFTEEELDVVLEKSCRFL